LVQPIFFYKRKLAKLEFELEKPSLLYRFNRMANFIDLIWMYSISQGHFVVPKLWTANTANIQGGDLADKKDTIKEFYRKLTLKTETAT
jgi:hypothetical protein